MSSAPTMANTRTTLRAAAPLVAMGATWAVRKGMVKGYEKSTGHAAPVVRSSEATLLQKVLWAAAVAGAIALIEVVVWSFFDDEQDDQQ